MFKQFTIQGNQKWLKLLPDVMNKYNNKIHSSIMETPINASNNPDLISNINPLVGNVPLVAQISDVILHGHQ